MNDSGARSKASGGGYVGEYRLVHRAGWVRLKLKNGKDHIFPSADEAEVAAWRELNKKRYPPIRSHGEKVSAARTRAENMFGAMFKRGRKIEIAQK